MYLEISPFSRRAAPLDLAARRDLRESWAEP